MKSPGSVAFTIFGFDIMWYGLLIALGFILAILVSYKRAPIHGVKRDDLLDYALWLIPGAIIGARAYYVIFSWHNYAGDIRAILDIRSGGLAIHGGLILCLIIAILFCRHRKIVFFEMSDLIFPSVALAQSIGRWGNFFNEEAHGTATDLPWAISINSQYVHPTFLYESIWCLLLFLLLLYIDKRRAFCGQITCLYGMLYSIERFVVEGLRTDSLMIGSLRQAQVLSASVFIVCLILYIYLNQMQLKRSADVEANSEIKNKSKYKEKKL